MVRKIDINSLGREIINNETNITTKETPATFEEAITRTGFGKFHYILLLITLPASWTTMISMINIAFVLPALQCEFNLEIMDLGILNASPFAGNIPGAFIWGYLADTMGRRKLMIYACLADAICNIICTFSVNMWMVAVLKFISGFLLQGPTAILMSYLSETFSDKYRSRIVLISGIFMGCVNLGLPLLAWAILPLNITLIKPWQLFLLLCTVPAIIAGICFIFLPESPKFLMMRGEHDSALKVFQKIYSMNSGKPKETYPITQLLCANNDDKQAETTKKISGWQQIRPMFFPPYLLKLFISLYMQFFILLGANTLKAWLPQLFSLMDEFDSNKNETASLCHIMSNHLNETAVNLVNSTIPEGVCIENQTNNEVFFNLSVVGMFSVGQYLIVTVLISHMNKKLLLGILLFISGSCGISLIWCTNPVLILIMTAIYATMTGVAYVTFLSITVDLFPTSFRTLIVSLSLTAGRIGSIIGNLVFPALLIVGCYPPFLFLGGCIIICIIPLFLLSSAKIDDV